MDINSLLVDNPVEPRRSFSNPHSVTAPSPSTSAAKLPTPPLSNPKPLRHKRKRHDPKPVWAILEHEAREDRTYEQREQLQPPRPPPAIARPPPPPPPTAVRANGPPSQLVHPQTPGSRELVGFERPVSNDAKVYDEISRTVCDFIWNSVVENPALRAAVEESPGTEIEIEARWGQILDQNSGARLQGIHETECVMRRDFTTGTKFESTMSLEQHKGTNTFLNIQVAKSRDRSLHRTEINYKHTKEIDMFYELDQAGFNSLPQSIKQIIHQSQTRQRIRVTRDMKTNQVIRKIIKHRIGNLEISSPKTEWDYRIGINLEIEFPGAVETLKPLVETGRSIETMERKKDRMSYSWLSAYQIDLTQVTQAQTKNHELELELDAGMVISEADNIKRGAESQFESLVAGMMNNLRVISREMTPGPR